MTRKALHAYVTDTAHDRWHGNAETAGVSVSAILEVAAGRLETILQEDPAMVAEARRIDATRRRRKPAVA